MLIRFASLLLLVLLLGGLQGCSLLVTKPEVVDSMPQEQPLPPELIEAYNAGLELLRDEEFAAAEKHWQELAETYDGYPGVWTNLALVQYRLEDYAKGLESLNRAIAIKQDFCPAYKILGLVQREMGQFTAAESSYQTAVQCDPADAQVRYNLGILYDLYLHDLVKALEQYQLAQSMMSEPDATLAIWIADLERRSTEQVAGEGS
ncbi:MAG: tetratricopeptide repeat protein [Saccharospirillaceae bacterium]|nr:tetratricopeptide repeat protein [Saccharospirillaceae bacterium]MCD8532028.1 tetratricopeptide repeat protein [Saccharospirillaceae bacterium]